MSKSRSTQRRRLPSCPTSCPQQRRRRNLCCVELTRALWPELDLLGPDGENEWRSEDSAARHESGRFARVCARTTGRSGYRSRRPRIDVDGRPGKPRHLTLYVIISLHTGQIPSTDGSRTSAFVGVVTGSRSALLSAHRLAQNVPLYSELLRWRLYSCLAAESSDRHSFSPSGPSRSNSGQSARVNSTSDAGAAGGTRSDRRASAAFACSAILTSMSATVEWHRRLMPRRRVLRPPLVLAVRSEQVQLRPECARQLTEIATPALLGARGRTGGQAPPLRAPRF
jgi:hypothetical protein